LLLAANFALGAASNQATIDVSLEGLRNGKGMIHVCLTGNAAHFPDCSRDPGAVKHSVAATRGRFEIANIPPGEYALSVIHDENSNGHLDTMIGIPREGFGFSRNPRMRMGPPRFDQVRFTVAPGRTEQRIRIRYIL